MPTYPDVKSEIVNGVTETDANQINDIEDYLGIIGSLDTNSITWLLRNPDSISPGHKHNIIDLNGGSDSDVLWKDPADHIWKAVILSTAGILAKSGGSMTGNLAMGGNKLTGLAAASGTGEVVRYDEWIAAQDPGHKHSTLFASDGSPQAVTVDAAGNVAIGSSALSNALFTIYSVDDVSMAHGLVLVDKVALYGTWQNPSGLDGIKVDANGVPTTITGDLYLNYYSSGDIVLNGGGGDSFYYHNVGVLAFSFGTSANGVWALGNGTPPGSAPANMVQMWSADINGASGYAGLHKRTETTNAVEIVPGVIIKTNTGHPANPYPGLMEINTYDNKVFMYADGDWRQLATW